MDITYNNEMSWLEEGGESEGRPVVGRIGVEEGLLTKTPGAD